jgi:hypothetical protein
VPSMLTIGLVSTQLVSFEPNKLSLMSLKSAEKMFMLSSFTLLVLEGQGGQTGCCPIIEKYRPGEVLIIPK